MSTKKTWKWVKLPMGILNDPIYARLNDRLRWRAIQLRLLAGQMSAGGRLPALQDMAYYLRPIEPEDLEQDCIELEEVGILSRKGGAWYFATFKKDQAPTDPTAAERMQRYRAKQTEVTRNVTRMLRVELESEVEIEQEPEQEPEQERGVVVVEGGLGGAKSAEHDDDKQPPSSAVKEAWENSTKGPTTKGIREDLQNLADMASEHAASLPGGACAGASLTGEQWVVAAIEEARASSDGRGINVRFVRKILDRWMAEGFESLRVDRSTRRHRRSAVDEIQAWAERKRAERATEAARGEA